MLQHLMTACSTTLNSPPNMKHRTYYGVFYIYVDLRSLWAFNTEIGKHYVCVVRMILVSLVLAVLWKLCYFLSIIVPMVYYCGGKF